MLQQLEGRYRLGQATGGHAPGANAGPHQVHRLRAARQPPAKDEAVERPEDQALGATGRGRNHTHVARLQPMALDVPARWIAEPDRAALEQEIRGMRAQG